MPYKKAYKMGTVGMGASKTPSSVMGSQGTPAKVPASHFKNKSQSNKPFPQK